MFAQGEVKLDEHTINRIGLAKRLVTAPWWRWQVGMLWEADTAMCADRVDKVSPDHTPFTEVEPGEFAPAPENCVPWLGDASTVSMLLDQLHHKVLVDASTSEQRSCLITRDGADEYFEISVRYDGRGFQSVARTMGEAVALALLAVMQPEKAEREQLTQDLEAALRDARLWKGRYEKASAACNAEACRATEAEARCEVLQEQLAEERRKLERQARRVAPLLAIAARLAGALRGSVPDLDAAIEKARRGP